MIFENERVFQENDLNILLMHFYVVIKWGIVLIWLQLCSAASHTFQLVFLYVSNVYTEIWWLSDNAPSHSTSQPPLHLVQGRNVPFLLDTTSGQMKSRRFVSFRHQSRPSSTSSSSFFLMAVATEWRFFSSSSSTPTSSSAYQAFTTSSPTEL